jgi:hypothetical protein
MVVEAAIDFSNGANREMWNAYRWRMSDNISPWRIGGFTIEERVTSEFKPESPPDRRLTEAFTTESPPDRRL